MVARLHSHVYMITDVDVQFFFQDHGTIHMYVCMWGGHDDIYTLHNLLPFLHNLVRQNNVIIYLFYAKK